MHGNATIAIIIVCVIIGALGLYYVLKTACQTLAYKTWEVGRKQKKVNIELTPPSAV